MICRLNGRLQKFLNLFGSYVYFRRKAKKRRVVSRNSHQVILVEERHWATCLLSLYAFLPSAIRHYDGRIVAYTMVNGVGARFLKKHLRHKLSILNAITKSKLMIVNAVPEVLSEHAQIIQKLTSRNISKQDVEEFTYRNILVGDIIYDEMLRRKNAVTIDVENDDFEFFASSVLQYCDMFFDYFEKHQVKAVVVSHPVYRLAIPARIAMHYGIDAVLVDQNYIVKMLQRFPNAYKNLYHGFKDDFSRLSTKTKVLGLRLAKDRLANRVKGNVDDLSMINSRAKFVTDFIASDNSRNELGQPKVLVALHDFHDAAHAYGQNFYPDFSTWLEDLGQISMESSYKWLIKPHPFALDQTKEYLGRLIARYPQFELINSSATNEKIVTNNVKYALTVYGSIAHELPHLGIPVINASLNHPHIEYSFSFTPTNSLEYRDILRNLETFDFEPKLDELYEYYFMRFVFHLQSWIIPDYPAFLNQVQSFTQPDFQRTVKAYFSSNNAYHLECIDQAIWEFLNSSDLRITRKHFLSHTCLNQSKCVQQEFY